MGKISTYTQDSSLDDNHYVPSVDPTGPTTKRTLLSVLKNFLFDQANIPSISGSPVVRDGERGYDFVASGGVWSPDNPGVDRDASMTAATVYAGGYRYSVAAVTGRTFTASRDTYVTVLSNGTIDYEEETNGAAPPTFAADAVPIALVVTDGSAVTQIIALAPRASDELGRARIEYGSGDALVVSNIPSKKYLNLILFSEDTGGTTQNYLRFNDDSAGNYAYKHSVNSAAPSTGTTTTQLIPYSSTSAQPKFQVIDIVNIAALEKLVTSHGLDEGGAGAAVSPAMVHFSGKWANTTDQITRIDMLNVSGAGSYGVGSEIIVKGRD